jgi:CDP-diacylglycerol--glycerol-3-phosphate 3-phosphatidyltransferase
VSSGACGPARGGSSRSPPPCERLRRAPRAGSQPAHRVALTPNAISLTGLLLNVVAAGLVFADYFFLGGLAFIVGSLMDTLDGRYSRMSGKGTQFGAFLDSTLDRASEGIVLTAVAYQFADEGKDVAAAAVVAAVLASVMVSYTRARAEALGIKGDVGIAPAPVRVVILAIGLLFAKGASLGTSSCSSRPCTSSPS